jgi:hypothetical protein
MPQPSILRDLRSNNSQRLIRRLRGGCRYLEASCSSQKPNKALNSKSEVMIVRFPNLLQPVPSGAQPRSSMVWVPRNKRGTPKARFSFLRPAHLVRTYSDVSEVGRIQTGLGISPKLRQNFGDHGIGDPPTSDAAMNNSSTHSVGGCGNSSDFRRPEKS